MEYRKVPIGYWKIWGLLLMVSLPTLRSHGEAHSYLSKSEREDSLAVRSRNARSGTLVYYHPAGRLESTRNLIAPVHGRHRTYGAKIGPSARHSRRRKYGKKLRISKTRTVNPILIKKTLRNENGVLRYRPVDYPHSKPRSRKRKKGKKYNPRTRTSSRDETARRRRKMHDMNRRLKKPKPTYKHKQRPTSATKNRDETTKSPRRKHHKPSATTSTRPKTVPNARRKQTTSFVTKGTFTPTVVHSRDPDFDISSTVAKLDPSTQVEVEESPNVVGLRRLYAPQSNPYGLQAPRGFRFTTVTSSDRRTTGARPSERATSVRSTTPSRAMTPNKRSRPTHPSVSMLQIPTSSIDDAYTILRGIGTGFRVRLVPKTSGGDEFRTPEVDEFDISTPTAGDRATPEEDSQTKAVETLQTLFARLSNATVFHPRRDVGEYKVKKISDVSTRSNRSWWESDNVCTTGSPGIFGLPPAIFDRLAVTTKCTERMDEYSCVERYGVGERAPTRTTSYRCCKGFEISIQTRKCEPVRLLNDGNSRQEAKPKAGLSEESENNTEPVQEATNIISQELTLFMPSDSVVNEYLSGNELDSGDKKNIELFLENHVVMGQNLPSRSLRNNQILTAMSGNSIRVNFFDNDLMTANCRRVLQKDLTNSNSIVHVIGDVIQEVKGSTYDYLAKDPNKFSMFRSVVDNAGLSNFFRSRNSNFTLFLPTNNAFESNHDIPEAQTCLANVVRNHLVPDIVCSSCWVVSAGKIMKNQLGHKLFLKKIRRQSYVNDALMVHQDIMTTNGVIHVIDDLIPSDKVKSVLSVLKESPKSSEMLKYLELAGMKGVLSGGENFTLLVPSNQAFQNLPSLFTNRLRRNPKTLKKFLLYHTIPFQASNKKILNGGSFNTLDPPKILKVTSYEARVRQERSGRFARQTVTAIQCGRLRIPKVKMACNGALIHMNKVLLPPSGSILATLQQSPRGNFSILLRAISRAKMGQILAKSEDITFFAPTNDAFEGLPARFVKYLFQNTRALQRVLRFHISKGFHCCDYLQQSVKKLPTLHGSHIASCPKKKGILLGRSKNRLRAKVVKCEIQATNGLIHAIDNVLIPSGFRN